MTILDNWYTRFDPHMQATPWEAHDGALRAIRPRCCGQTKGSPTWDGHGLVLKCPGCGADRHIPLTFPIYQREAGPEVTFRRPVAKCSGCGERIFAKVTARQRLPKSSWVD
jgi:hypothetical protein